MEKTIESVSCLIGEDDYSALLDESINFLNSHTVQALQKHLIKAAASEPCYLTSPGIAPTIPGSYGALKGSTLPRNPFFVLEDDPLSNTAVPLSQERRAATLVVSALRFICALRTGALKPDTSPASGNPLSMTGYNDLFGSTRIPDFRDGLDIGITAKKCLESRHIVVLSRSQFYTLEVLTPPSVDGSHKLWFSRYELCTILKDIMKDSERRSEMDSARNAIGSITTESKRTWAWARSSLQDSNPDQLKSIDDALFVLCLDHECPTDDGEKASFLSHGTCRLNENGVQVGTCISRWYDKLQLVVTKNSVAAAIWESVSMDGTNVLRFIGDIYTDSVLRMARKINGSNYTLWPKAGTEPLTVKKPKLQKLEFNLSPGFQGALHLAETRLTDLISQHRYVVHHVKGLGSNTVKDGMGLSTDSFVQMCFQIAYYALYGTLTTSSEPVSTRKFQNSRSDAICIQSKIVLKCCQSFLSNPSPHDKWNLFKEACHEHKSKVKTTLNGKGFERHWSALRSAFVQRKVLEKIHPNLPKIPDDQVPPLLFDNHLDGLYHTEILIANCGNPSLHLFGLSPATESGYGIGYIIKDNSISVVACSQWRQTERFLSTFQNVVEEVQTCWRSQRRKSTEVSKPAPPNQLEDLVKSFPMSLAYSNKEQKIPAADGDYMMGGYDYFDVGELYTRSEALTSRLHSRFVSSNNSSASLSVPKRENENDRSHIGRCLIVQDEFV